MTPNEVHERKVDMNLCVLVEAYLVVIVPNSTVEGRSPPS